MRLLVIQHTQRETPGNVVRYLKERGILYGTLCFCRGESAPEPSEYDAVIILGGNVNVHDDLAWKDGELAFIKEMHGKKPMLGICLGAQLIAHALDANVRENPNEREIGFMKVMKTKEGLGSPLFAGFESEFLVMQWHGWTFDLPYGAELLISSATCANQAFSIGNTHGVQFHLDVPPETGLQVLQEFREWALQHPEFDEAKFVEDLHAYADTMREQCFLLLDNFIVISPGSHP